MNEVQLSVLRVLLYFDNFAHPLTPAELFDLLEIPTDYELFRNDLEGLIRRGYVAQASGFCFIPGRKASIEARLGKMKKAEKYLKVAFRFSRLIFRHPFVRAVFITGSLSKRSVTRKDDIDFFVITEPGRLWICKTLLMIFKKVFLLNSKKYFCINYFIDSDNLEIPDRNFFTAVELVYLRPLQNPALYMEFMSRNSWIHDFFPNKILHPDGCMSINDPWIKKGIETILGGGAGERLDNWFLKIYRKRADRKFHEQEPASHELNFRSLKYVSKYHPNGYQQKILDGYENAIREFEIISSIDLSTHKKTG